MLGLVPVKRVGRQALVGERFRPVADGDMVCSEGERVLRGDRTRHCDPQIKSRGKQSQKDLGALRPLERRRRVMRQYGVSPRPAENGSARSPYSLATTASFLTCPFW